MSALLSTQLPSRNVTRLVYHRTPYLMNERIISFRISVSAVYLKNVIPDQLSRPLSPTNATDAAQIVPKLFSDESAPVTQPPSSRHRRNSSGGSARVKFVPVLEVLTEMAAESAA
uniref:Uncharacterized protein n=1 Tax=Globodera pallida TaxID=36090 RepID=A0A183BZW5_GLOPA